jgi:DNA-binding response OmpR family regulator
MTFHPDAAGARAARVLVVDDDPTTRTLLQQVLRSDGYDVEVATSGEEALLYFQSAMPDLVLLDVMMPGIDGFATCERMRQLDPHLDIPIVMLTGADDYAAIDRAFAARATDFISKPFQWRLLLQRVRYALRTGRLNRELRLSRSREATARRLARLIFFHWHLDDDQLTWSDRQLPLAGATVAAPTHFHDLVELVIPAERRRVDAAIRRARVYGEPLDVELLLDIAGHAFLLRLVGQVGSLGTDQRVVSGALQDITDQRRTEELAAAAQQPTAPDATTPLTPTDA